MNNMKLARPIQLRITNYGSDSESIIRNSEKNGITKIIPNYADGAGAHI